MNSLSEKLLYMIGVMLTFVLITLMYISELNAGIAMATIITTLMFVILIMRINMVAKYLGSIVVSYSGLMVFSESVSPMVFAVLFTVLYLTLYDMSYTKEVSKWLTK